MTMAQLLRNESFDDLVNNLFQGFLVRPLSASQAAPGPARPFSVEVREDEKAYALHAELPGVARDDIHVTIDGNDVAITAEVKNQRDEKQDGRVLRSERYYGKLYRAFQLADAVDESAAEAKYADGVLELRLPKKTVSAAKRLEIR
jgi:HSP20 family protein